MEIGSPKQIKIIGGVIAVVIFLIILREVFIRQQLANEKAREKRLQAELFTYYSPTPPQFPVAPPPVPYQGATYTLQIPGEYSLTSESNDLTIWTAGTNTLLLQSRDEPFPTIRKDTVVVLPLGSAPNPDEMTIEAKPAKQSLVQGYGRSFTVYSFPCSEEYCFYNLVEFQSRSRYHRIIAYGAGAGYDKEFLNMVESIELQ